MLPACLVLNLLRPLTSMVLPLIYTVIRMNSHICKFHVTSSSRESTDLVQCTHPQSKGKTVTRI